MLNNVELNEFITVPVQIGEFNMMHPLPKRNRRGTSSAIPKQRANNHAEFKNLLSLPDDILEEVLSFLEIRQLVQFSIVAKKFRYCFKYGKRLDFDLSFRKALINNDQYQIIVGRIMDEHEGSKIHSLKLCFTPINNLDNQSLVAHWINNVAKKGVEEVELNFDHGKYPFRVTADLLFQIKTLEILRLVFVDLGSLTKDFQVTGLQFLRVCSMKKLNINVVILDILLKSCTTLEILEIIHCYTPNQIRFSAGNLKKFKKFRLANCATLEEITINAPSLTTVHYSGDLIVLNFENCGNFIDFLVDLKPAKREIVYVNHFKLEKLISNLFGIKVLTTTSFLLEKLKPTFAGTGLMDRFYSFPSVKEINLTLERSRRCDLLMINYFLRKFPRCERLFIDVRGWLQDMQPTSLANSGTPEQQQPPSVEWTAPQTVLANPVLTGTYPHLEQVKLTGFRFETNEMELLHYFLRNGHNLKTMAIFLASPRHWRSVAPDEAVFNYNLRLMITSPNLWIKLYQHKHEKKFYPAKHPKNWRKG